MNFLNSLLETNILKIMSFVWCFKNAFVFPILSDRTRFEV